jgi:hypothetical protein
MNASTFKQLLTQLDASDWQAVAAGQCVLLVDDLRLAIGPADAPNAVFRAPPQGPVDAATLKRNMLAAADELLSNYYLTHPLTLAGFDHQAKILLGRYGAAAFAAPTGQLPSRTLFVDGGEVVAESSDSPRHRYGAYCELDKPLTEPAIKAQVQRWLERGEAYQRYLSMNVCRYNC